MDTNRPAGTYKYTVDAVDSAGNRSANKPAEVTVVVANDPPKAPHDVIGFPARDFISATGYVAGRAYNFSLFHPDGKQYASVNANASTDGTGTVEVNHPGGACWIGTTPNMKPGDVIRITDTTTGVAEQTTVANVAAERPLVQSVDAVTGGGTVVVHGTAQDSAGKQIPVASLENRLVANKDPFDLNGRRTVRAGGAGTDGTLTYDAAGSIRWTATYTFQTPNDLARAVGGTSTSGTAFVGAESRAIWLGRDPAALNEQTIFENGAGVVGGPAGLPGCTDVAETPAPGATLSAAPTFADTTVGSTSAAQTVTIRNSGDAPLNIAKAYLAGLNPGDYSITVNNANLASVAPGASVTVQVAFKPGTPGTKQANLSFVTDAANTTDLTVPLVAKTPVSATRTATAPVASLAAGSELAVRATASDSLLPVDFRWTGSGPSYQLQIATGANTNSLGAFTDVPSFTNKAATSATVSLKVGTTTGTAYQLQVRACDATTCSAYAQGPKFTLLPIDDAQIPAGSLQGHLDGEVRPRGLLQRHDALGHRLRERRSDGVLHRQRQRCLGRPPRAGRGPGAGAGRRRYAAGRGPVLADRAAGDHRLGEGRPGGGQPHRDHHGARQEEPEQPGRLQHRHQVRPGGRRPDGIHQVAPAGARGRWRTWVRPAATTCPGRWR